MTSTARPSTSGPLAGEVIDVHNPVTGAIVGSVRSAGSDEVAAAVARARAAQKRWARRTYRERAAVVNRLHDLVLGNVGRLLDTVQDESGKCRRDAITEALTVAGTIRYYVHHGERHLRDRRHAAAFPVLTGARVVHKPHGVVGLITPWNYPLLIGIADAVPALLAGNAVVTKPSEVTPLSAHAARELALEAGLDPDLLQIVDGRGDVGAELIRHVDYVGFTGSTATGRAVAHECVERLVPFSLELGGKNPMLVLPGARIDDAVSGLVNGAFPNSGQTCIAIERVYVHESVYDRFVERAVERVRRLRLGWSHGWDVDMGSLVSEAHADKVEAHIADALDGGATLLAGGRRLRELGPAFVEPTLLAGVDDGMRIAHEETFGPVVSIHRVRDAQEAIERSNASSYGLNASVWAGSTRQARDVARELMVGSAGINSALLIYNSFDVPMGGVRESGVGRRHGAHGIRRYTVEQSIVHSFPHGGGYESIPRLLTSERRAGMLVGLFRLWNRVPGLR